jgi:hypothetical protein
MSTDRRLPNAGNRIKSDNLRIGFSSLLAAAVFLLPSFAFAQAPKAIITGPKEAQAGDLIVLDASESTGTSRLWLLAVSPVEKSFLPVDSGLRCVFATGTPGKYTFVLVVAGTNPNGGALAEMTTHSVTVQGTGPPVVPPVVPPIVTPPDPTLPPVTTGVTYLVVIRENQELTADQAATLQGLLVVREGRYSAENGIGFNTETTGMLLREFMKKHPEFVGKEPEIIEYINQGGEMPWALKWNIEYVSIGGFTKVQPEVEEGDEE